MIFGLKLFIGTQKSRQIASFTDTNPCVNCRELLEIFDVVQRFPKGSVPKLSPDAQVGKGCEVVDVHGSTSGEKILRYVDPVSHNPDPNISYRYVTAFTYMHCQEMGRLSEDDVRANVKLQLLCGTLSYSQIPRFYQHCLAFVCAQSITVWAYNYYTHARRDVLTS